MTRRSAASIIALGSALASACPDNFHNPRTEPVCALQDCASGKILDDGCAENGKCKPCINDCGGKVAPRK
jgi:hypothetical protein